MKRIVTILAALLVLPSVASAASFTAYYDGTGRGTSVAGKLNGESFDVWAGEITWTSNSSLDDFISYCIQMDKVLTNPQVFDVQKPSHISSTEATQIGYLVATNFAKVTSDAMAAGLQLAIWNVLYDHNDYSLLTGDFTSSQQSKYLSATTFGNQFLADLAQHASQGGSVIFLDGRTGQDQVTVPEPASLLLLGAGAAMMAARRRRLQTL